jgi:hypothetical protein
MVARVQVHAFLLSGLFRKLPCVVSCQVNQSISRARLPVTTPSRGNEVLLSKTMRPFSPEGDGGVKKKVT